MAKHIFIIAGFFLSFFLLVNCVQAQSSKKKKKKSTIVNKHLSKRKSISQKKKLPVLVPLVKAQPVVIAADTALPKMVTITSTFKPSLGNAAKIYFTAATPVIDTYKIPLIYNIPSQNLFFSYQPVAINPIAMAIDTSIHWENNQYIKLGWGNYSTPYAEAGLTFGNGKKSIINLTGQITSSKGQLPFQQFTKANIQALGIFNSSMNEYTSKLYYNNNNLFKYGYTSNIGFSKNQLQQNFNALGFEFGVQNKQRTDFGIIYHPQLKMDYFFDNNGAAEYNFTGIGALNKAVGRIFALDLALTADVTSLSKLIAPSNIQNNIYSVKTSIQFNTPNFKLNAGVLPTWDNNNFSLLPNVTAEVKLDKKKLILMAGWVGSFTKNTYHSLSLINPYIEQPPSLLNTKVTEQYVGIKGSKGEHITYNAKLSFVRWNNQVLFVNDTAKNNTQTFNLLYEPSLTGIKFHSEVGYTVQERLSFIGAFDYTLFTSEQLYNKPFGILPLELTGTLRYKVTKDLILKSDLFFWDGTHYQTANLQTQKLSPAIDFNAGAEFSILPKLNLWVQFNNMLNSKYERWNQYQVLGFNVLGGVVYSFQ